MAKTVQVEERDLTRWKLIAEFQRRLAEASATTPAHPTWQDRRRHLAQADYLSLFLFGLFNPVVESMRGLGAASRLRRVQEEVCARPVSLGSFSEAQAVVEPALLEKVFQALVAENQTAWGDPRLGRYQKTLQVVDSTVWAALPRMAWAVWHHQHGRQCAVRLHVKFRVLEQQPASATLTPARVCERAQWKKEWQPGDFHVGDRYYGEDYSLLTQALAQNVSFVVRLRQNAQWVEEEILPVAPADQAAGVVGQSWVRLGKKGDGPRVRLVILAGEEEPIFLVTDQAVEPLSAELVGLIYRYRWQVELFFKWLKCILGCRHWLAESPEGVALQVYSALICAQLLLLYGGQRPNKRAMEAMRFYLMGWASLEELSAQLGLNKKSKN